MPIYLQRQDLPARKLTGRRRRRYLVRNSDGPPNSLALHELDKLLDGRAFPADFWACVTAADELFDAGDRHGLIEWPIGRRVELPAAPD